MNDMVVREVMNGILFVLDVELVLTFVTYLSRRIIADIGSYRAGQDVPTYSEESPEPYGVLGWYERPGSKAAIALTIYFAGATMRAGWIWWLLHCENAGGSCFSIRGNSWVMLVATALAMTGGLCCIRVFSPPHWHPWSWLAAGVVAVAIPFLTYLVP